MPEADSLPPQADMLEKVIESSAEQNGWMELSLISEVLINVTVFAKILIEHLAWST